MAKELVRKYPDHNITVLSIAMQLKRDVVGMGFDYNEVMYDKPEPIRALLQAYGQARRHQDENYWLSRLSHWVDESKFDIVIIDDVRFPNEADWVRTMGGSILRLECPDKPEVSDDLSETALDDYPFVDYYVTANKGQLDLLLRGAESFLQDCGFI